MRKAMGKSGHSRKAGLLPIAVFGLLLAGVPWLTDKRLDVWTHNKTIQKAVESRRITPEQKQALRALRIRSQKLCEERCV